MSRDTPEQKNITLIGEVHDEEPSHLRKVEDLIREKLATQDVVMVALEEDKELRLDIESDSATRRRGQKTPKEQIDKFAPMNHAEEYKDMFRNLQKDLTAGKKIIVAGVDDAKLAGAKDEISLGTKRDRAMKTNIDNICTTYSVNEVIYAVGSAHIFASEDRTLGQRLGSRLEEDPAVNLEVKNFYPAGTEAHATVQSDIDAFKEHHNKSRKEPSIAPPLSLRDEGESQERSTSHSLSDQEKKAHNIRTALESPAPAHHLAGGRAPHIDPRLSLKDTEEHTSRAVSDIVLDNTKTIEDRIKELENTPAAKAAGIKSGEPLNEEEVIAAFIQKVKREAGDGRSSYSTPRKIPTAQREFEGP